MLVNKENIVLEAGVEMWLKSEVDDNRIVVAVNVGVDTIQSFEHLL
jgi:hypothetical protein